MKGIVGSHGKERGWEKTQGGGFESRAKDK
jgi:hypothetical protein